MAEDREKMPEIDLEGYKARVAPVSRATLTWERDLVFTGQTAQGYEIAFDAALQEGCSPTESLLLSLAGCMAIDMVSFLRKMRCEIRSYRMDVAGRRHPTPPQRYAAVEMTIAVTGSGLTQRKMERAVSLSQEKYCSVHHSLRPDLAVTVTSSFENLP
ncbi:MAG TPA: OsmC family protein [Anaeromyxobacteraceae bacterium]|jgi:putative redox protein|nr:OsmC family protein [Anaeromyxobacteraceae bacterium]